MGKKDLFTSSERSEEPPGHHPTTPIPLGPQAGNPHRLTEAVQDPRAGTPATTRGPRGRPAHTPCHAKTRHPGPRPTYRRKAGNPLPIVFTGEGRYHGGKRSGHARMYNSHRRQPPFSSPRAALTGHSHSDRPSRHSERKRRTPGHQSTTPIPLGPQSASTTSSYGAGGTGSRGPARTAQRLPQGSPPITLPRKPASMAPDRLPKSRYPSTCLTGEGRYPRWERGGSPKCHLPTATKSQFIPRAALTRP